MLIWFKKKKKRSRSTINNDSIKVWERHFKIITNRVESYEMNKVNILFKVQSMCGNLFYYVDMWHVYYYLKSQGYQANIFDILYHTTNRKKT